MAVQYDDLLYVSSDTIQIEAGMCETNTSRVFCNIGALSTTSAADSVFPVDVTWLCFVADSQ